MNNNIFKQSLFLVVLTYKVSLEKIELFKSEHIDFLETYYAKNCFLLSGPQVPRNGGLILAQCDSKDSLYKILKQDPFAINNLATYEIIEFSPTKFSKLFNSLLQGKSQDE